MNLSQYYYKALGRCYCRVPLKVAFSLEIGYNWKTDSDHYWRIFYYIFLEMGHNIATSNVTSLSDLPHKWSKMQWKSIY